MTRLEPGTVLDGIDRDGAARLIVGTPGSGKTEFALSVLMAGLRRYGGTQAVMAVSGRVAADALGNRVIRELGFSVQARPVTTLGAVAFRAISASREGTGLPSPRLLNGAEQDALLRQVMAVHLRHAVAGDDCGTCDLLRVYFAQDDWARLIRDAGAGEMPGSAASAQSSLSQQGSDSPSPTSAGGSTSADRFTRGISDAFISQLRDMLARLDELGVGVHEEPRLLDAVTEDARLSVQWRLAFALRREYIAAQSAVYPGQYRLDASYLLVAGARVVREAFAADHADDSDRPMCVEALGLPRLLVVDDVQDTTLAGMRFLEELGNAGVKLVLVGNPDESVQTFRGSYPEYLMRRAVEGRLKAKEEQLVGGSAVADQSHMTMADVIASRISLSIPSPEDEPLPPAERPGKLTAILGGVDAANYQADGTVTAGLYRSSREELDDVVWRIKRAHLDRHIRWNDMAVITHDNAAVRLFGERLRRDGVPVRYSSVTRPLKDETFVQGLFALVELARLRAEGMAECQMTLASCAAYIRTRVATLMNGPLVSAGAKPGQGRPARLAPIESAMGSLESLAHLATDDAMLTSLTTAWETLRETYHETRCETGRETSSSVVSTSAVSSSVTSLPVSVEILGEPSGDDLAFGVDALYVMLAIDDAAAPAQAALASIHAVLGNDPQARAFANLWHLVGSVASGLERLPASQRVQPRYALSVAWNATGLAPVWQRAALFNTAEGRTANDRLDAAMRLFQFADDSTASRDITSFMAQVRGMEVQADSLAHIGPVEDAVTLTTPAGAAGRHWEYAWIPVVQQDVWPNLAGRNTMFGGEDLAELVLRGALEESDKTGHDPRFAAVLSGEKKGFLVALTRARRIMISAVWNDSMSPSDFLFGYLPEYYPRNRQQAPFTTVGAHAGFAEYDLAGLDADPRGLVSAARAVLATAQPQQAAAKDAAIALALLLEHGVRAANPQSWAFVESPAQSDSASSGGASSGGASSGDTSSDSASSDSASSGGVQPDGIQTGKGKTDAQAAPMVTLSPSAVDSLWACPVCWMLENRFAGPRPSSVATSFGTLIHAVAQQGSEEGLDHLSHNAQALAALGLDSTAGTERRIEAVSARLNAIYQSKRPDPNAIADTRNRYEATRKDESAADALRNIADYFVRSDADPETYLGKNSSNFSIGALAGAECEREFAARFDVRDILDAYNAVPGLHPIGRNTLVRLMGALVGGWPEGMDEHLTVRLSGRIDRMETRVLADGGECIRLIDYKTGRTPTVKQIFNDLQLVCYQLGLVFPEDGPRGAKALAAMPHISQSVLFHVGQNAAPARSYAPEGAFQPPLFTDGSLNAEPFTPRYWYKDPNRFFDIPAIDPATPPEGVSAEAWAQFAALAGTQTLWSLTMIARVFYAAAASRSAIIEAHPQDTHIGFCRMKNVCPACAGQIDTIFETRQA